MSANHCCPGCWASEGGRRLGVDEWMSGWVDGWMGGWVDESK
jgi:hypothetical protein